MYEGQCVCRWQTGTESLSRESPNPYSGQFSNVMRHPVGGVRGARSRAFLKFCPRKMFSSRLGIADGEGFESCTTCLRHYCQRPNWPESPSLPLTCEREEKEWTNNAPSAMGLRIDMLQALSDLWWLERVNVVVPLFALDEVIAARRG